MLNLSRRDFVVSTGLAVALGLNAPARGIAGLRAEDAPIPQNRS